MSNARATLNNISNLVFNPELSESNHVSSVLLAAALVILYLGGVAHWIVFFNFGDMSFTHNDWIKEFIYYSTLREAINEQVIPYTAGAHTDKFIGHLEPVFSPQIVLLPIMSVGKFVLVNTLLLYSLGFVGCLLLKRRYGLSLLPFTMLFLLFNFNGHITSHISVGHSMWNGYFLLPFFILLVLEVVRPDGSNKLGIPIMLGFVLFGMVLQGSFHLYFWCLMFLGILGLFNRQFFRLAYLTIVFSAALSAFRLLPALFVYGEFQPSYASGFPTIPIFVDALTTIKAFTFEHPMSELYDVGWWEHDFYIGFVGVAFVAFFGIYQRFSHSSSLQTYKFKPLDLPLLLLALFSFGLVFDLISDLSVPFLSWAERVPSRFFIIPLVVLIVLGAIRMQALLSQVRFSITLKVLTVAALVQLVHSLAAHTWFWRIPGRGDEVERTFVFDFNSPLQRDLFYQTTVNVSALISLLAIVLLSFLFYWKVVRKPA